MRADQAPRRGRRRQHLQHPWLHLAHRLPLPSSTTSRSEPLFVFFARSPSAATWASSASPPTSVASSRPQALPSVPTPPRSEPSFVFYARRPSAATWASSAAPPTSWTSSPPKCRSRCRARSPTCSALFSAPRRAWSPALCAKCRRCCAPPAGPTSASRSSSPCRAARSRRRTSSAVRAGAAWSSRRGSQWCRAWPAARAAAWKVAARPALTCA
mmetsp:Transcript_26240/g.77930  ORF Transcript_26240/g.77930 Transcript_26240/m.77930 type:complete len:214 (+) Transcript_26240:302-943(+)